MAMADVKWHEFDVSLRAKQTMTVSGVAVTIETRDVQDTAFKEDYLVLTVRNNGQKEVKQWFTSSYGLGAVAVEGGFLLLKHGVGRGTSARVEHVKVFRLGSALEELIDVQTSYYVDSGDPKRVSPDVVEYRVNSQTSGDYTTITFSIPKPYQGLPSEKIVKLKNDG